MFKFAAPAGAANSGETPGEGLPAQKQSTGLFLLPLPALFLVRGFRSLRAATKGRRPLETCKPFGKGLSENF